MWDKFIICLKQIKNITHAVVDIIVTLLEAVSSWMVPACDVKIISMHLDCSKYMCSLHHFADFKIKDPKTQTQTL